ncbi:hypothetical protein FX995_09615 [Pseudoalteromonas flavipulchra]|uniref:hypothetical protein n=1 Tax=Pseudoalteromonas maricaloris TaxID=184924 RepID=UPI00057E5FCC|nr:hypothetical protein [Pseudoalteromonas flavipulchra]KID33430.1 hypothetical protein QT15_23725 [Pseudoalteromonas flavipulchra NCIMB 2033 = ATCC BAA-314]MBD0781975.1 hypothetical protein [Pseudoalteromonas flavipulchra]
MSAFLRINFQMLFAHFGIALFSGSIIGWAEGLDKGLLFGVIYFIFMFIVHFYIFYKHRESYGKNPFK